MGIAGSIALIAGISLSAATLPGPVVDENRSEKKTETAVFAGGCFWGVEAVFDAVKGVSDAVAGYAGGSKANAHYEIVSTGTTGHAESVEITFDPSQISFGKLLEIYFSVAHDPTQLNRQGPDTGTQYRSAIFYRDESQKSIAQAYIAQLDKAGVFKRPIVTQINQLGEFYPAEAYHQDYATIHPTSPYIVYNDLPKVENLRHVFADLYRDSPVLVSAANQSN
ncbi:MAG TPA: peptide-methionine (S)-S-oxide reductase MsrA [Xanthobacteraceae bacterium]